MSNSVVKKIMYYVDVRFVSPVSVSSGNGDVTDDDVLRDYEKNPFIAGSSLAGAMRSYLNFDKNQKCIFGYGGKDDQGQMSSLYISDLEFTNEVNIVVRDGVGLTDDKTAEAGAKFDMEAIDTGATGRFTMELIVREKDDNAEMCAQVNQALYGIDSGEIRLGNKKTRGYGEMELVEVRKQEYTKENILGGNEAIDKALPYSEAYNIEKAYELLPDCKADCLAQVNAQKRYVCMEVPLKLTGGISIRKYSSKKGEPDMVHLTANGEPVIPGTSFAGAVRSCMKEILRTVLTDYSSDQIENAIRLAWGYVDKKKKEANKSNIIFAESVIKGASSVRTVRTGVSRFESSAKDKGLREELIYTKGQLDLRIHISKDIKTDWIVALLLMVVKELQNGYLPVGGQTSVGRGIFEENGEIKIDGNVVDEKVYFKDFRKKLEEGMACQKQKAD